MNHLSAIAVLSVLTTALHAQVPIVSGHADIGVAYENNAWDLHVHDETNDIEYEPGAAVFRLDIQTHIAVPGNPAYSFLGNPGASAWVLPQTQQADMVFLGLGTEELDPADWNGTIQLTLKGVSGPGSLAVWDNDAFGNPTVLLNSANGIDASETITLQPGGHRHLNWGFTAPGQYSITFEASGNHALDGITSSGDVSYQFSVVPEPGPVALSLVGLAVGAMAFYRKRSATAKSNPAA